jgi:hypothetical protein
MSKRLGSIPHSTRLLSYKMRYHNYVTCGMQSWLSERVQYISRILKIVGDEVEESAQGVRLVPVL